MSAEQNYGFPLNKADVSAPILSEKLDKKLGLRTDNPFTQTPAKRIASALGLGLAYGKYRIRIHAEGQKELEWHSRSEKVRREALSGDRTMSEFEELIFGGDEQKIRDVIEPALASALNASDASQAEVEHLIGRTSKDPKPFHKINYDAGNTEEGRIVAVFPGPKPIRFRQESTGEATMRTHKEASEALNDSFGKTHDGKGLRSLIAGELAYRRHNHLNDQVSYRRDTGEAVRPLVHHRWIEAWGHKVLPLPAKRERQRMRRYTGSH